MEEKTTAAQTTEEKRGKELDDFNARMEKQDKDLRIALKWFGTHALGVFLALILIVSFVTFTKKYWLQAVMMAVILFLYYLLMGNGAWQLGHSDRNRVKFGRKKADPLRGFRIASIMSIPLWILGIFLLLAKAELLPNFYPIYKIINSYDLVLINLIDGTYFGTQATYLTEDSWGTMIAIFLLNLVPAVTCEIQYFLGFKDVSVFEKIIYKNKKVDAMRKR